jgi:hypothetical protein
MNKDLEGCRSSISKALTSINSIIETDLSLGKSSDYKAMLRCRLEVQYTLASLLTSLNPYYGEARSHPKRGERIATSKMIIQIKYHLATSLGALRTDKGEDAFAELLAADALLGDLISSVRGRKKVNALRESA